MLNVLCIVGQISSLVHNAHEMLRFYLIDYSYPTVLIYLSALHWHQRIKINRFILCTDQNDLQKDHYELYIVARHSLFWPDV